MERRRTLSTLFLLLSLALIASAQTKRPMQPEDILRINTVADAQISPDGRRVAYIVTTVENFENKTRLWLASTEEKTAGPALLLDKEWLASSPRWSPDSKRIAFSASRDGKNGIWTVSLEDRSPRFVVAVKSASFYIAYAGESFAWSPDGKRIAFVNAVEEPDTTQDEKNKDPIVVNRVQYKTRTGFSDHLRIHVFVVDADGQNLKQLTNGRFYDHAITWNPNGEEIAFLSNRGPNPEAVNNSDIFAVNMNGNARRITDTKGCEYEPAWSPDGKWIAYTATKREITTIDSIAEDAHVWVIDAKGGVGRELNGRQDRRSRNPRWSSDSLNVFYLAIDRGAIMPFSVPINPGDIKRVFPRRDVIDLSEKDGQFSTLGAFQVGSISVSQKASVAFSLSYPTTPSQLFVTDSSGVLVEALSQHNEDFTRGFALVEPDYVTYKSFDNTPIEGWLLKPVGFQGDKKYPLILAIHGGPHSIYGYNFQPNYQVFAARGYAVLMLNPRGTNGYGQKFSDGSVRDWGGGDYKDLMAGVDYVLKKYPWIDGNRMGVTGLSYGGYMTMWIVTQTDRFKAGVALAGLSNNISFYGTSLYQDLVHAEFGFPWDNYDLLWERSPLKHVKNVKTPLQMQHGENDNDVHITQSEELYTALRLRGVAAELIRYPREGHVFREPKHRVDSVERILAWFDKYLK
jgi:dipeptidyl aminopeptidase/acylaminoacyl peptidase